MDRFVTMIDVGYLISEFRRLFTPRPFRVTAGKNLTDLITSSARELTGGLGHLRNYWYDGKADGECWRRHDSKTLYEQFGNVFKYGTLRSGPNARVSQKRVDSMIVADFIRFGELRSVSDIVLVSGDEDLIPGVEEAQYRGIRVQLLTPEGLDHSVSQDLWAIADGHGLIPRAGIERSLSFS